MAANDNATVTIDTGEMVYTDTDGMTQHTVNNAQTLVFDLTGAATGSNYRILNGQTLTCTDGTNLTVDKDPAFTWFHAITDAAKNSRGGAMRIHENDGQVSDFELDVTIDNVDEPTTITILATDKTNPMRTWSWSTITVTQ